MRFRVRVRVRVRVTVGVFTKSFPKKVDVRLSGCDLHLCGCVVNMVRTDVPMFWED